MRSPARIWLKQVSCGWAWRGQRSWVWPGHQDTGGSGVPRAMTELTSSWQGWAARTHRLEGAPVTLLQQHLPDVQVLPHQQQLLLVAQLEGVTLQAKGTGSGHQRTPTPPAPRDIPPLHSGTLCSPARRREGMEWTWCNGDGGAAALASACPGRSPRVPGGCPNTPGLSLGQRRGHRWLLALQCR